MKRNHLMLIATLLIAGASVVSAQSLGDYARTVRKDKSDPVPATRHFDNDNLPINDTLSVVGPAPAGATTAANSLNVDEKSGDAKAGDAKTADAKAATAAPDNSKQTAADNAKSADDLKKKIDEQQAKINSLNREVDLDQREERLRAASYYQDAGTRLRNPAEWTKEQTQNQNDAAEKQKALDAARQKLDEMQEEARKSGISQRDIAQKDKDKEKEKDSSDNK